MDKIAFFYELGYQMAKEATENPLTTNPADNNSKQISAFAKILKGTKLTSGQVLDIYKALLPFVGGEGALGKAWGGAGLPAKIVAPTLPALLAAGGGYGGYKLYKKRKESKKPINKLLAALGLR